jgi:hypothetical protein
VREHKIIAITPAGRRAYLEILGTYILKDSGIDEWHLWDNCRQESDRIYINKIAKQHAKIRVVQKENMDGSNRAINQLYQYANDIKTFYIKIDDDIVYTPKNLGASLYDAAIKEKDAYTYWSPLIINNAICSWLLKYHSHMSIEAELMASAACIHGWRNPRFALELHRSFLDSLSKKSIENFEVPNFNISLARFSINCIGFWGEDVNKLGERFCPLNVDDEEWISAVLPSILGRPGRIIGDIIVSHFSFFTQEDYLLKTELLDLYSKQAGIPPVPRPKIKKQSMRQKIFRTLNLRFNSGAQTYTIAPKIDSNEIK